MSSHCMRIFAAVFMMSLLVSCGGGGGGGGTQDNPPGSTLGDLVVTTFSAPVTGVAGTSFTVTGTLKNQGGAPTAGVVQIYLSPNSNVTVDGGSLGFDFYWGFLDAGQSWNFSFKVTLPTNIANGTYYLSAVAQGDDPSVGGNNIWNPPVSFTVTGGTTCSSDGYEADNSAVAASTLTLGVSQQHNHCEGTSDWMQFSATAGTVYGFSAARVGTKASPILSIYGTDGSTLLPSTSSGSSLVSRVTWTAPANGTYYVKAAPWAGMSSAGANTEYLVTVGDQRPDLVVVNTYASSSGLPGGIIWASDTVRNQGFISAGTFTVSLYLSADAAVTTADTLIGSRTVGSLAVDQSNYSSTLYYTLPSTLTTGAYYLAAIVNPEGTVSEFTMANNISAALSITVLPLENCSPDQYEQYFDDLATSTTSTIIVNAEPQSHNHCDDTADWIKLSLTNGSSYSIRLTRSGLSSAWVELYAADGTTRLAGYSGDGTTAIDWPATTTGIHYLKVGSGSTGNGRDYTIQVQPTLPDLIESVYLQNGTSVAAGGFLNVTDTVSNVGYLDAGAFEIGFYYSAATSSITTAHTLGATRSVATLPAQGSWQSTNTSWMNYVHFPKSLPTGTYYLAAIADHSSNAVIELNETNNASPAVVVSVTAPTCAWDAYEDDDDLLSAKAITAGEIQNRNFCDDELDWVTFTPPVNGMYVVSATNSVFFSPYQADGTTPVPAHDTYFYSKFSLAAAAGTTYYLKGYNGSGAYQLTVFQCALDAFEDDDTAALAQAIAVNETQTRNHCEDRNDWAKFTAVQNTAYTITATNGQNVYVTLYNTDGQTYLASGASAQGGKLKVINWTALASGTYYIKVDRFEFGQNTDYTLNLK